MDYDKSSSFNLFNPDPGFVLCYDSFTGWPKKTGTRDEALSSLGELNYFGVRQQINGIAAVARVFNNSGKGVFFISDLNPSSYDGNIGVRTCRQE